MLPGRTKGLIVETFFPELVSPVRFFDFDKGELGRSGSYPACVAGAATSLERSRMATP